MEKNHFSEDEIDLYLERAADTLGFYRENLGEGANIEYRVRKRFKRVELRLIAKGENLDPLQREREEGDTGRSVQRVLSPLVWNQHVATSHAYISGRNRARAWPMP